VPAKSSTKKAKARKPLMRVRDLYTEFYTYGGTVKALNGVNLDIYAGETLGLVGETGCGKSVTSYSIMRLIPTVNGKIVKGMALLDGTDLFKLSEKDMRKIRGNKISMIFQEPMTSLNPVYTINFQISEVLTLHQDMNKEQARARAAEMLKLTRIADVDRVLDSYPHELSGGMLQRCMIAMAMACNPRLLIADEPTTALDVTIQAQILELMRELTEKADAAILYITHDLAVIAEICQRVAVMYAGNIVERGPVETLFAKPSHPYTKGLLASIPQIDDKRKRLDTIEGTVPDLIEPPGGCRFHPRCQHAMDICSKKIPPTFDLGGGHGVACYLFKDKPEVKW